MRNYFHLVDLLIFYFISFVFLKKDYTKEEILKANKINQTLFKPE